MYYYYRNKASLVFFFLSNILVTDASYFIVYRICIISCFSVSQYDWMSNDSFFILFPFAIVWYFVLYIDSVASLLLRGIGVSVQICLFCIDILSNWIVLFVGWEPHRINRFCHGHYLQAYLSKYKCKSVVYSVLVGFTKWRRQHHSTPNRL